jgi:hypothetical protein
LAFTIKSFNADRISGIADHDQVIGAFVGDRLVEKLLPCAIYLLWVIGQYVAGREIV